MCPLAFAASAARNIKPDVLKRMDVVYHGIFERNEKPHRTLSIPDVSL